MKFVCCFWQAMVDYTAERGWLCVTLKIQQLMQSVIQARWFDESEFLTLPHVNNGNVQLFYQLEHNYEYLTLPTLKDLCRKEYEIMAKGLRDMFEEPQIEQIYKVINYLFVMNNEILINFVKLLLKVLQEMPEISVTLSIEGRLFDNEDSKRVIPTEFDPQHWTEIHPNEVSF